MPSRTALLLTLAALAASTAGAVTPAEQEANCAEAARRYEEVYGKAPTAEQPPVVMMFKHTFCPVQLTVRQGASVRFVNVDKRTTHSFWFRDDKQSESDRFFSGEGTEIVADFPPGEHTYLCGPHWESEGMVGKLTVTP